MTIWNLINQELIQWTGLGLLHASVLALLAWLLSATLLRRCPPALQAGLWTVVLVKFLLPPLLPGDYSLSSWLSAGLTELGLFVPQTQAAQAEAAWLGSATAKALPDGSLAESFLAFLGLATSFISAACLPLYLLLAGWLSGRRLAGSLRLWHSVSQLPEATEPVRRRVAELANRIGLDRSPQVLVTDEPASPFVIGLRRPRLVLPEQAMRGLDARAAEALIVHELAHLRRRDHWVRSIQNLARLLLFFWPPVWWVCRRIDRFAEMACDQWAVTVSRISPQHYAQSLLEVARTVGGASAHQQKLAFAQQGRMMEERFEMILNRRNSTSPRLSWISLLLLAAWATFAWAGGAAPQEPQRKVVRVHQAGSDEHPEKVNVFFKYRFGVQTILEEHPEADLDGDGELSASEMKSFHAELRKIKLEEFMAQHPEADLDGDGEFSVQERAEFHRARRQDVLLRVLEEHPEADLDGDGTLSESELKESKLGNVFYFSPYSDEVHPEGISHEMSFDFVLHPESADHHLIKEHPEGALNEFQFQVDTSSEDAAFGSSEDAQATYEFRVAGDHLERVDEQGDSEDGRIHIKLNKVFEFKSGDATTEWVFEGQDRAPLSSEERLQRLIETNPEADLDGDGKISSEEARSFAAKLQSSAKKKKQ